MNLTFSGIDEFTNIDDLKKMYVEFGILLTLNPEGRNRYPSLDWISNTVGQLTCAIHICGRAARKALLYGELNDIIFKCQRIQVNGKLTEDELTSICKMFSTKKIITQHNDTNKSLYKLKIENHQILVDASGGKGILPDGWPSLNTNKLVGYAGGLNFQNIIEQNQKIKANTQKAYWLDMENGLRDENDKFSVQKATDICDLFSKNSRFTDIMQVKIDMIHTIQNL
jgi:hypothetical protein